MPSKKEYFYEKKCKMNKNERRSFMKQIITILTAMTIAIQIAMTDIYAGTPGLPLYVKEEVVGRFNAFLEGYNILLSGVWFFL